VTEVEVNPNRLLHLLSLFGMTKNELLERISHGRKTPIEASEIFGEWVKSSHLRKIDDVFKKGIAYYIDPKDLHSSPQESVFFRKNHFNAELNFGAKRIVNQFENEKLELSALSKLADAKFPRLLPTFDVFVEPSKAAGEVRRIVGPISARNPRGFLKASIDRLAELNVLVFEFVETWNQKEKANIDGCFLKPDMILLKRNQNAFRREIFTLYHELGHFLLNEEEIDDISLEKTATDHLGAVEKWCSSFAFFFLLGDREAEYSSVPDATITNQYSERQVRVLTASTFLSSLAIYTRLKIDQRISRDDYELVRSRILHAIEDRKAEEKRLVKIERERAIAEGRKPGGATPKPIISPLYLRTLKNALLEGLINEVRFCKKLRIKPERLEEYFS